MDIDIRKQSRHGKVDIHRPHTGNSSSGGGSSNPSPLTDSPTIQERADIYHEPVSDGEQSDEEVYTRVVSASEEARRANLPEGANTEHNDARLFRENKLREEAEARIARGEPPSAPAHQSKGQSKPRTESESKGFHFDPLAGSRQFDTKYSTMLDSLGLSKLFHTKQQREEAEARGEPDSDVEPEPEMVRFSAPAGKRISVPVRIEPKVIFANEVSPKLILRFLERRTSHRADCLRLLLYGSFPVSTANVPQMAPLCSPPRYHCHGTSQLRLDEGSGGDLLGLRVHRRRARRGRLLGSDVPLQGYLAQEGASSFPSSLLYS